MLPLHSRQPGAVQARGTADRVGMVERALLGGVLQRTASDGRPVLTDKALLKSSGTPPTSSQAQQCHPARLRRTYRNGEVHLTGYLNDYAFLTEGLLNLYEATLSRVDFEEDLDVFRVAGGFEGFDGPVEGEGV